jgi:hypothetical protein
VAIVVVQNLAPGNAGVDQGATSTYTPGVAFTAGNTILMAFTSYAPNGLATSMTVGGNAGTRDESNSFGTDQHFEIWRVSNLPSAGDAVINWSGGGNYVLRGILEVSGLENSGVVDQNPSPAGGTGTSPSITSGTTTQADELVFAVVQNVGSSDVTFTQPGSYTSVANNGNWTTDASGAIAYRIISATGAQTATWTSSGSINWAAGMVTYKASASVPGTSHPGESGGRRNMRSNAIYRMQPGSRLYTPAQAA